MKDLQYSKYRYNCLEYIMIVTLVQEEYDYQQGMRAWYNEVHHHTWESEMSDITERAV